jgi:hypothetical protein
MVLSSAHSVIDDNPVVCEPGFTQDVTSRVIGSPRYRAVSSSISSRYRASMSHRYTRKHAKTAMATNRNLKSICLHRCENHKHQLCACCCGTSFVPATSGLLHVAGTPLARLGLFGKLCVLSHFITFAATFG